MRHSRGPRLRREALLAGLCSLVVATAVPAQDTNALEVTADVRYYDFWIGTWQPVENGRVDSSGTTFIVRRSVHPGAMTEEWRSTRDNSVTAHGIRAWDKTTRRWMFVWVSANGLFQTWEGRPEGSDWYVYNRFDIAGDRYLSRQGWLPQPDGSVVRVSQKSYDEGRTWEVRFRQRYVRVRP